MKNLPTPCYISPMGDCRLYPVLPFSGGSLKSIKLEDAWGKLMQIYKSPHFFELLAPYKKSEDYLKMKQIPFVGGEYPE